MSDSGRSDSGKSDSGDPGVVDARGLRCPLPVIRLAQRAQGMAPGTVLEVWATDPAARSDIPAWCRMRGHELVAEEDRDDGEKGQDGGYAAYVVRLRA
jgi:tRNA 2-thiouridine synthesizing protein A